MGDYNICHAGLRFNDGSWLIWPINLHLYGKHLPKTLHVRGRTFILKSGSVKRPLYYEKKSQKKLVLITKDDEIRYLKKLNESLNIKVLELTENLSMLRKTIDYLRVKMRGLKVKQEENKEEQKFNLNEVMPDTKKEYPRPDEPTEKVEEPTKKVEQLND